MSSTNIEPIIEETKVKSGQAQKTNSMSSTNKPVATFTDTGVKNK